MLDQIKAASQNGLVLCFAGVGSAFSKKNNQSSLIIAKNGVTILIDIGTSIPKSLSNHGIKVTDFDYYHITHSHADHIGGMEELMLMSRFVTKKLPQLIITENYQDILWEKSLKGGCEYNTSGKSHFSDYVEPLRPTWMKAQPREMYQIDVEGIHLVIFRTKHIPGGVAKWEQAFWSTGLTIDQKVIYTADTRFDPDIFVDTEMDGIDTIFHDCQLFDAPDNELVHATYNQLKTLRPGLKAKMYLHHYGDNFEQFHPEDDGFKGFAKEWVLYQF